MSTIKETLRFDWPTLLTLATVEKKTGLRGPIEIFSVLGIAPVGAIRPTAQRLVYSASQVEEAIKAQKMGLPPPSYDSFKIPDTPLIVSMYRMLALIQDILVKGVPNHVLDKLLEQSIVFGREHMRKAKRPTRVKR